jgi:glycogen synthase
MSTPLHVLMTVDAVGGVWTYALTLAAALRSYDVRYTLVVMGPSLSAPERARAEALGNVRLIDRPYRLEWMADPDADLLASGQWLLRLARHLRPDLVHINGYAHAALPWHAPVLTVAHSCVRSWWRAVKHEPAPAAWDAYTARVRAGLIGSSLVVAPTRAMASALREEYAYHGSLMVVPNGLAAPRSPEDASPHPPKESYVFAAGRFWDEAKNLAILDKVGGRLPWPMLVAGSVEGPDGTRCEPRHVWHLGPVDRAEVLSRMAHAAIYVHPARYEPFGLSVLEAAQAGCVLVLGDIPSLRELWGDAAVYVDPCDAAGLRQTLAKLIANPAWLAHLGEAARKRAQPFDDRRMAEHYLAIYQALPASQEMACAS